MWRARWLSSRSLAAATDTVAAYDHTTSGTTRVNGVELRALVRASVAGRSPVDEREERSIASFLAVYDGLTDPFAEEADPVHVTASAIVVGTRGVVLHRHKRLGIWLQPGGHIDPDESPWEAAGREAVEETGLTVCWPEALEAVPVPPLLHVDVHPGPRGHTHLDLRYLLVAPPDDPRPGPGESPDVAWFEWDHARALADPGLIGALQAASRVLPGA